MKVFRRGLGPSAWAAVAGVVFGVSVFEPLKAQDTVVVHADQPPVWGTASELLEEMRIGSLEGSVHETFGKLSDAAVGPSGETVVVDQQGPTVRLFDFGGRYVRYLGRRGQGPGEYLYVAGVRFTRSGRIAIWDPGNGRITVYREDGTVVRTIRVASSLMSAVGHTFQVDTAGDFYVRGIRSHGGGVITQYTWIEVDSSGEFVDSIPIPPEDPASRPFTVLTSGGPLEPFTVKTASTLSPYGYEVVGRNSRYTLYRALPDGRTLEIAHTAREVRLGAAERRQWQTLMDYFHSLDKPGAEPFSPIPSEKPFFRSLWADQDGRIWVQRYASAVHEPRPRETQQESEGPPPLEWVEPPVWDVFDERGQFLGTVTLPAKAQLVAAQGLNVWAIAHGTFGESYLVRYRVKPEG
jgi:hypothetical protein